MAEIASTSGNVFVTKELFLYSKYQSLQKEQQNSFRLHYYIAIGGKKNKANVREVLDKHPTLVSQKDPEYGLTPFAVAIISGDKDSATLLKERGAEVECRDHKGWTPMHYAVAQGNMEMQQLLLNWNHRQDLETKAHLTPKSISERLHVQPVNEETLVFSYKNLESGSIIEGTALQFFQFTGGRFVSEIMTSPKGLFKEWCGQKQENCKCEDAFIEVLLPLYREFKARPSRLFLDQSDSMGWGVFAKEKINRGEIVEEYLGERIGAAPEDNNYYLKVSDIDGKNYRNLGPMINDGFPNVYPMHIYNEAGVWIRTVFVAIDDIEAKEELYWDYGESHISVKQHHVEKRMAVITQWLRTIPGEKWLNIPHNPEGSDIGPYLDYFGFSSKVCYLYNTPKTTFSLMLKEDLDPDLLHSLRDVVQPEEGSDFALNANFMIGFFTLLKDDSLKETIRTFMLDILSQNSFLDLWPVINYYIQLRVKKEPLPNNWKDSFIKIVTMRSCLGEITENERLDEESFKKFIKIAKEVPSNIQEDAQGQLITFLENNHSDHVDKFKQLINS